MAMNPEELEVVQETVQPSKKLTAEELEKFIEDASQLLNSSEKLKTITIEGDNGIRTVIHKNNDALIVQ